MKMDNCWIDFQLSSGRWAGISLDTRMVSKKSFPIGKAPKSFKNTAARLPTDEENAEINALSDAFNRACEEKEMLMRNWLES